MVKRSRFNRKLLKRVLITLAIFTIVVLVGAAVLGAIEGWNYLDSFYSTMMYVTTIGISGEPETDAGKVYVSLYSVLGVGTFFYLLALVAVNDLDVD